MTDDDRADRIAFRDFDVNRSLPDLLRWLGDPDVRPWYDEGELTMGNIAARFAPRAGISCYSIVIDDQPAGYIQTYRIGDEPEYQRKIDVDPDAIATDLFIGEAAYRNRGWGTIVLRTFVNRIVFGEMGASLAMIAPDPKNLRAVRSYEKVGFRQVKTVHVVDDEHPGNTGEELVMLMRAPDGDS